MPWQLQSGRAGTSQFVIQPAQNCNLLMGNDDRGPEPEQSCRMPTVTAMYSPFAAHSQSWEPLTLLEILCRPIPNLGLSDRWLLRALAWLGRARVRVISGLEFVDPANDPFILVLNHSTRRESLLVPAALLLHRGGRLIHFMADWNFRMVPGLGLIYGRAQTITVTRKSARPRLLNALKPWYLEPLPAVERARAWLLAGRSVGIFPEARVNRDSVRLLKGRTGAAFLSLETGLPIIPAGIYLPDAEAERARHSARCSKSASARRSTRRR